MAFTATTTATDAAFTATTTATDTALTATTTATKCRSSSSYAFLAVDGVVAVLQEHQA